MRRLLIPLLAVATAAIGHLNPSRPNAGSPAPTARPWRYRGRHAANRRKRDTR